MEALQVESISPSSESSETRNASPRNVSSGVPFQAKLDQAMERIALLDLPQFLSFSFAHRTEEFDKFSLMEDEIHLKNRGEWKAEDNHSKVAKAPSSAEKKHEQNEIASIQKNDGVAEKIALQTTLAPYVGNVQVSLPVMKSDARNIHTGRLGQLIDELVEQLSLVRSRDKVSLSMTLRKSELGEIKLTATEQNGKISFLFLASPEAVNFLKDHQSDIAIAMAQKGILLANMDVHTDTSGDSGQDAKNPFIEENLAYNFVPQSETGLAQNIVLVTPHTNAFFVRYTIMASA